MATAVMAIGLFGCSSSMQSAGTAPQPASGGPSAATTAAAPSKADVTFMSGMIPHHAQAVIMAAWAPSHGARQDVLALCERIVVYRPQFGAFDVGNL